MVVALIAAFLLCLILVIALKDDEHEKELIKKSVTKATTKVPVTATTPIAPVKCM